MVKTFTVPFEEGLHARPATELVKICQNIQSDVVFKKNDMNVNPKSILGILTLEAKKGDQITVEIQGADEKEAMKKLEDYFTAK